MESIVIFSAKINLLWRLNKVWVSIKLYYIYIYVYVIDLKFSLYNLQSMINIHPCIKCINMGVYVVKFLCKINSFFLIRLQIYWCNYIYNYIYELFKPPLYIYIYIHTQRWFEKLIDWCHICCWWLIWLMEFKHCNINGRNVLTAKGTMLKNKPHLVSFHSSILVSL